MRSSIRALLAAAVLSWGLAPAAGQAPAQKPGSPASQRPPQTATPQVYPADQVRAGQSLFVQQCGFCHGRDAAGGESGPDLTRSTMVAEDVRGDKVLPLLRSGRADKGMPPFNLPEADLAAIVAFMHDQKTKADSLVGDRRSVEVADLQTGSAEAGERYFKGGGNCTSCHSPTGDLAGVATRFQGLALMQRMLYPVRRGQDPQATATVTLPSGEVVTGKLVHRDEFTIALKDAAGWHRSWPTSNVKFTVKSPIDAHVELLRKYTDGDIHDLMAYLQTLR
jgi:cytochrome c oxidase cbb3-type subunit 3